MKFQIKWFVILLVVLIAVGCTSKGEVPPSEGADQEAPEPISEEPVTLTLYTGMPEETFQNDFKATVAKKYPFITLERVASSTPIAELVVANQIPDILHAAIGVGAYTFTDLDVLIDLAPFIRKHQFDLGRINERAVAATRAVFGGDMLMLPFASNNSVLYYNKSIFDKFGVDYPTDGMSWEEIIALARQVSREDNGVTYRGLHYVPSTLIDYNQLSLSLVDGATERALVNSDGWRTYFNTMKQIHEIPGNEITNETYDAATGLWLNEQTLAMIVIQNIIPAASDAEKEGLDWDVVTMPSFTQHPDTMHQMSASGLGIATSSEHPEQAFLAIMQILSDDEQHHRHANLGSPAVLNTIRKEDFGTGYERLQGKNAAAFVKHEFAYPREHFTRYDPKAVAIMNTKFRDIVVDGKDVNTALREAEEEINLMVEQERQTRR